MKVTFLMLGLKDFSTGGYYFNNKVSDALVDAGHSVDVIHFNTVPVKVQGSKWRGALFVLRRVLSFKPSIIVVSKSYSFMILLRMLLFFKSIPVLYLVHHLEWHDRRGRVSNVRKFLVRWFISVGKRVWVNSKSTADDVVELGIFKEKLVIIPPGFEQFRLNANRSSEISILCVGTVCERKDQLTLVKACSLLKARDFTLYILGDETTDPEYASNVRAEAESLAGKVIFMGHLTTEELYAMYNQCHFLANLSRWEGHGIAVVEALWAGLPVLAVNAGAVPELVTNGYNGFLIEPGDVKACAERLLILLEDSDLREEMSLNAHVRAEKLFTWSDTGREFVKLVEETARS